MEAKTLWKAVQAELELTLSELKYKMWIAPTRAGDLTKDAIEIMCSTLPVRKKLETEFKNICSVHLYAKNVLVSPHILNVTFKNIASETLILYLDARGIYVTGKSACKSGEPGESHVLEALKRAKMNEYKEGSVRFSFGRTKKSDVDYIIKSLKEIFKILNIN